MLVASADAVIAIHLFNGHVGEEQSRGAPFAHTKIRCWQLKHLRRLHDLVHAAIGSLKAAVPTTFRGG